MPVQKFKTFEEAEQKLWNFNPDKKYYQSITDLFNLFEILNKRSCEKGIRKFKTLQQANIHRIKMKD